MEQVSGWAEQGGSVVVIPGTQGSGVQRFQQSFRSATITVRDSSNNLATIYSDDLASPTAKANPFTASSTTGSWNFYTTTGTYTLTFSGGSILAPFSITVNVGLGNAGGVPSYAFASLPTSKTQNAGDLARVNNVTGGLWMDSGFQWVSVSGEVVNVKEKGAKGDGTTDDRTALATAVAALPSSGGILYFPPGTYTTNSASPLLTFTDKSNVTIMGCGRGATVLKNTGAGNIITAIGTSGIENIVFRDFSIDGNSTAARGIACTNLKDSQFLYVNISSCLSDSFYVNGVSSLNNLWFGCRVTEADGASATARALNLNVGNNWWVYNCYFNGIGAAGGTGYDILVEAPVTASGSLILIGNSYDGCTTAVKTFLPTTSINERFDFNSPGLGALTRAIWQAANNKVTIVGQSATDISEIWYTAGAEHRKYFSFIGANDGSHCGFEGAGYQASIAPAALAANTNDYAPTDATDTTLLGTWAKVWQLSSDATVRNITGIANGLDGRELTLQNVGSTPLRIVNGSASSVAANRIIMQDNVDTYIRPRECLQLTYLAGGASGARWYVTGKSYFEDSGDNTLTPSQITGDQNNYAPASAYFTHFWRLSSDAPRNITGISIINITAQQGTPAPSGYRLALRNVGSFDITLIRASGSSSAENRIITSSGNVTLTAGGGMATLMYDATSQVWGVENVQL